MHARKKNTQRAIESTSQLKKRKSDTNTNLKNKKQILAEKSPDEATLQSSITNTHSQIYLHLNKPSTLTETDEKGDKVIFNKLSEDQKKIIRQKIYAANQALNACLNSNNQQGFLSVYKLFDEALTLINQLEIEKNHPFFVENKSFCQFHLLICTIKSNAITFTEVANKATKLLSDLQQFRNEHLEFYQDNGEFMQTLTIDTSSISQPPQVKSKKEYHYALFVLEHINTINPVIQKMLGLKTENISQKTLLQNAIQALKAAIDYFKENSDFANLIGDANTVLSKLNNQMLLTTKPAPLEPRLSAFDSPVLYPAYLSQQPAFLGELPPIQSLPNIGELLNQPLTFGGSRR